jgi:2-succinyl-6-hydroxy-2,4-cyclohexadiene-1-carboxylate synthase
VLFVEERGEGRRLVLVHGFTQSGRTWGPIGDELSGRYRLMLIDAPGHGRSARVEAGLPDGADQMAATVTRRGGPAAWLGYSMGGRYALHVALRHPDVVERLILVSTTAGIDDPTERAARRESDEVLARRAETEGLERFLQSWLAQPLFANLAPDAAEIGSRMEGSATGLASSLRRAGAGKQEPLWDQLRRIRVPVLILAGRLDKKYAALAERMAGSIGTNAQVRYIEGAGHACHLERPDRFVEAVTGWL